MPSLRTLAPGVREAAEQLFRMARAIGPFVVTSARRSRAEQTRLYNEALAGRNDGLPAARPGTSDHEYGEAFDLARLGIKPQDDDLLPLLGQEWRLMGGYWSAADPVHFGMHKLVRGAARGVRTRRRRSSRTPSNRRSNRRARGRSSPY